MGPLRGWSTLSGGHANDLYRLQLDGPLPSVVLRSWRRAPDRAATELAVMRRASAVVPVPDVLAQDLDPGAPLALLEDVAGVTAEEALAQDPQAAQFIGERLGDAFARLSQIQFAAAGLIPDARLEPDPWPPASAAEQLLGFAHPRVWSEAVRASLGPALQRRWWTLIEQHAPLLSAVDDERSLVHADANPKNVMVRRDRSGWSVAAVLDWEFALSGPSLMDLGNLLRYEPRTGSAFASGVQRGWQDAGGPTPPDWLRVARTLDVYSLLDFVTRPGHPLHGPVVQLIRSAADQNTL
ncbi:phosphotransferase [Deinococcus sonorensis]|uniref:Phosphotransferase n=1 Tax=Deinococcus sonorensis TaxID=309891 RepID=A0ABV8Y3G5_9DEIO